MRTGAAPETLEPLVSVAEVGRVLGLSRPSAYRLIARRELASVRVGGRTLVRPGDLRAFIESHRVAAVD